MHDWTLESILFEWADGKLTLSFRNTYSLQVTLTAFDVARVVIPKMNEWGRSVSVNTVNGPYEIDNMRLCLEIEMQSGDVICIDARSIVMPQDIGPT